MAPLCSRTRSEILDGFRFPGVAAEIGEERQQGDAVRGTKGREARVRVDGESPLGASEREPLRGEVSQGGGVFLQGDEGVCVPVDREPEPDLSRGSPVFPDGRADPGEALRVGS